MESSSSRRMRIFGVALTALAVVGLAVVGVVMLNGSRDAPVVPLERALALAKIENANVPMSQVPLESEVHVPEGWQVESDEPMEGPGTEEDETDDHLDEQEPQDDEDIDHPLDVEEDEDGQKYVAELDEDVIVDAAEDNDADLMSDAVAADGKYVPRKCKHRLRKCGYRKVCSRKCKKNCKPYAYNKCKAKKYCKCFCKYYGKVKTARKCVVFKRRKCRMAYVYRCRRGCKKYCRRVPRCYCCGNKYIKRKCWQMCKYYMYKTKCGKCRCRMRKCYRKCRMVCRRYKKY